MKGALFILAYNIPSYLRNNHNNDNDIDNYIIKHSHFNLYSFFKFYSLNRLFIQTKKSLYLSKGIFIYD